MRKRNRSALLAVLACGLLVPASSRAGAFEGEWFGGFRGRTDWVFVRVTFGGEDSAPADRIDLPLSGERGILLDSVRFRGPRVSFEVPGTFGNLLFEGKLEDGRIRGFVRMGFGSANFELLRKVRPDERLTQRLLGNYDLGDGRIVLVYEGPQGLAYVDYGTGRMGPLYPIGSRTFVSGPTLLSGYPVELTVRVDLDAIGEVTWLTWDARGEPSVRAPKRVLYRTEDVAYASGTARISASLLTPPGPGPSPAVVMIHGSGPATRSALMPFADVLVRSGVAVLVPDKRGAGRSSGDGVRATFADLAGDALAGVAFLKRRPGVNPTQIGLQGASLGGWVAPLAASRSSDVKFIIVEAAPTITPAEHERQRVESQMRADSLPRDLIVQALAFMDRKFDVGRSGKGWDGLVRLMNKGRLEGWLGYVNPPSSLDSLTWHVRQILDYDPLPALEQLKCPVLAVYGELDTIVPVGFNRRRMEEALERAGNTDVTVTVFPKANHNFFAAITGGPGEVPRLRGFVPGYFTTRVEWVLARVDETVAAPEVAVDLSAAIVRSPTVVVPGGPFETRVVR